MGTNLICLFYKTSIPPSDRAYKLSYDYYVKQSNAYLNTLPQSNLAYKPSILEPLNIIDQISKTEALNRRNTFTNTEPYFIYL